MGHRVKIPYYVNELQDVTFFPWPKTFPRCMAENPRNSNFFASNQDGDNLYFGQLPCVLCCTYLGLIPTSICLQLDGA